MQPLADVIVVGSGASAVNAAVPLVEAGRGVRMLDVGNRGDRYQVPDVPLDELRRTDPEQHRYLLGDNFEGIGFEHMGAGAQLTPPRQFVCADADRLQPVTSTSFFPLHSLAEGGLAGAWGAGSPSFVEPDFAGFPIGYADLAPHYEAVAARIGINGERDDLLPFLGELAALQPAVHTDDNGRTILARYAKARARVNGRGLWLGHPRLAMLSQPLGGRAPTRYHDLDFWSDAGKSVYRPRWTVDELRSRGNFELVSRKLVTELVERGDHVEVIARDVDTGMVEMHRARTVVLGAGTLGSTRIALRSLAAYGNRVPIVCNPHTYMALVNLNQLGKPMHPERHSLAQLCVVHAPDGPQRPFTVGHLYSYRSLLMFRLMKDAPLPHRDGLEILRHLSPSFVVMILQHADTPTAQKYCELDGDRFTVEYELTAGEQAEIDAVESNITKTLYRLRLVKMRTVRPGHAASTHFAGTLPMQHADAPLTTDRDGQLRGMKRVFVVDGSVFPTLPSKGLTFTMMANANRIGAGLAKRSLG
ncbi:MAG TPA: GMC oxidoreductase [Kofleriaceae bacterium]|nr:GMC oxidoreductase [Kofleriaceae bacterium]